MTKEEILKYFEDINFAYNDCSKYDTLSSMLNELEQAYLGEASSVQQAARQSYNGGFTHAAVYIDTDSIKVTKGGIND